MNARENILERIRRAIGTGKGAAAVEARLDDHPAGPKPPLEWDTRERFKQRATLLSSTVDETAGLDQVPGTVARYLREQGLPTRGICWPSISGLDWNAHGIALETRPAAGGDLVGVTGAFCAIADTGTLMLLSGPDTPAAASLLPETHIAVLPVSRIVKCMEDAWALLREEKGKLPRAVNFVSGPSRTADIEQTVTLGAHGPYRVHIILVRGEA